MEEIRDGICGTVDPCSAMKEAFAADEANDPNESREQIAKHAALLLVAVGSGVCPSCHRKIRADA